MSKHKRNSSTKCGAIQQLETAARESSWPDGWSWSPGLGHRTSTCLFTWGREKKVDGGGDDNGGKEKRGRRGRGGGWKRRGCEMVRVRMEEGTTREMNHGHGEHHNTIPRAVLRWRFQHRFVLLRAPRIYTRTGAVWTVWPCMFSFEKTTRFIPQCNSGGLFILISYKHSAVLFTLSRGKTASGLPVCSSDGTYAAT